MINYKFLCWWDDNPTSTLEEYNTKFKELVNLYNPKPSHINRIMESIQWSHFRELSKLYERYIRGHATNFTHLYSLAYSNTAFPYVQKKLVALITKWKNDVDSQPKPSPLATIAMDKQNIHTAPVMRQQDITCDILFNVPIPKGQQTLKEISDAFLERYVLDEKVQKVIDDMTTWGRKSKITEDNDYLYRKIIRHLWAKIKEYKDSNIDIYSSLIERLMQELVESLGMCAMGHVNRLCNVLCGFMDGIESPRNSKETFQDMIAKLAAEEKDINEKKKDAILLMDTYGIEAGEREAWIDALEV